MPLPIPAQFSDGSAGPARLLFAKTDWVYNVDVNSYCGPDDADGTHHIGGNPVALPLFKLAGYKRVVCYTVAGAYTGATNLQWAIHYYDQTPHPGNFINPMVAYSKGVSTSGGGEIIILTDELAPQVIASGVNFQAQITIAPKPIFCQFQPVFTGTATALASLRTFVYGIPFRDAGGVG